MASEEAIEMSLIKGGGDNGGTGGNTGEQRRGVFNDFCFLIVDSGEDSELERSLLARLRGSPLGMYVPHQLLPTALLAKSLSTFSGLRPRVFCRNCCVCSPYLADGALTLIVVRVERTEHGANIVTLLPIG